MTNKQSIKISKANNLKTNVPLEKKQIPLGTFKKIDNCCSGNHSHTDNCCSDVTNPKEKTIKTNSLTKEFILKGLDCANCANKIERQVNALASVYEAVLNFSTSTLIVNVKNKEDLNNINNEVVTIVKKLEPDVEIIDKSTLKNGGKDSHAATHHNEGFDKKTLIPLSLGGVIFFIALIFNFSSKTELVLYLISYILVGGDIVLKAIKGIFKGEVFDENFLMTIATIGAFGIKEFPEAVAVMLFYKVGETFQGIAVNRSRKSISSLMDIRPDSANLKVGNDIKVVSPSEVSIGDIIIVKPGEKIPLDGTILDGSTLLDTSALTGESVPRKASAGDDVLSGSINKNSLITIKVTKNFGDSTVSKILDLVQNAGSKKAKTEKFITKFARYYTPVVVFSAIALAVLPTLLFGLEFKVWLQRALIFLVVSCPCALVISVPLGFFAGIGSASRAGVLIKGGNYLEALNEVTTIVFDKTGTLTKGIFEVTEINLDSSSKYTKEDLLKYAAYGESFSTHPIATSIAHAYKNSIDKSLISNYEEISGHGIKCNVMDKEVLLGNAKLMKMFKINFKESSSIGTIVYVAINNDFVGSLTISDMVKDDSKLAIKELKAKGINKTIMLTGDNKSVGDAIGMELGLDKVYTELLPQDKVSILEEIIKTNEGGKVAFVGDGVNDAPVIARADVGIAMGGLGSDAAIEAADIVLMTDEPSKIVNALNISNFTKKIVTQNIIFALGVKALVLIFGAFGIATMWEAIFADVGVSVIAIINAMRILKINSNK